MLPVVRLRRLSTVSVRLMQNNSVCFWVYEPGTAALTVEAVGLGDQDQKTDNTG